MSARLISYQHVPQGFEMLVGEKEICPGGKGGIWNLWWNIQLTDDPEAWDEEVRAINKMQRKLDEVAQNLRLIRAHMAEFCRVCPLFSDSVDILCEETGVGGLTTPWKLGCEGRNLLEYLGYHDADSMKEQRIHSLKQYSRALERWLSDRTPVNPIDAKVSGFLGEMTEPREIFVKGILSHLESGEFSLSAIKDMCKAECKRMMGEAFDTRERPLHCFDCGGSRMDSVCLCSHGTLIDVGILCTRVNDSWTSVLGEYKRFAEEYILAYAFSINSWLINSVAEPVTSLIPCRYVTKEIAEEIPVRIRTYLGKNDDSKAWLATCLLKTLKGNQRWHKTRELIDDFPEATSWLSVVSKTS